MSARYRLEEMALRAVLGPLSRLPLRTLRRFLESAGLLLYRIGVRRGTVLANLRAVFGNRLPEEEIGRIGAASYRTMGRVLAQVLKSDEVLGPRGVAIEVSGFEGLEAESRKGRGVILLSAHLGAFLLAGYHLRQRDFTLTFVAKRMKNPLVDGEFQKIYGKHGNPVIPVAGFKDDPGAGIALYRALRQGATVTILNDQNAGPEGYHSTFFGLPTYIPRGPALFAHRAGAIVMTGFAVYEGEAIRVEIQPPIDYSGASSPEEAASILLDEYSRRLEEKVREHPDQYFWLHKKWKSVPGLRAIYDRRGA